MKRVLITSAAANMIWQFNKRNIEILLNQPDVEVHVGTNFISPGTIDTAEVTLMKKWMAERGVQIHQIDFQRGVGDVMSNIKATAQIKKILKEERIDLIHTQSPIGAALTRVASIGLNVKLIYTAHGFHFFKGAPKKYWVVFYPLEYILSKLTDVLITINEEDFNNSRNFLAKKKVLLPGVGISVKDALHNRDSQLEIRNNSRLKLANEFDIPKEVFLILNVGELSNRKNQEYLLEAMSRIDNENIHVALAGIGPNKKFLEKKAESLKMAKRVHFLGYRNDIRELHYAADLMVFPSKQEGLALGGLESVVDGLYLLGSDTRGIRDYILSENIGQTFSLNDNAQELSEQIQRFVDNPHRVPTGDIQRLLMHFDRAEVDTQMADIYQTVLSKSDFDSSK
ncbi:glycosyltransferase [Weissella confusa]|uniref:glycosyltransferase n=1 Tax=Weissella confusa TaxID=1583 RepID=UPI0022E92FAF|nr:glycosyltransferase [Weissella confusa]